MATQDRIHTFSALRESIDFRWYIIGQLISITGLWMQAIAQGYLVFQLTKSEAWLGIVACASGLSVLLLSPLSGVVVERISRRRLIYYTQVTQMGLALLLFVLTITQTVQVWHIVCLAFLLGITNALDLPARQTFLMEVVGKEHLTSAIALNSIINNITRIIGPALAGVVLVSIGPALCFLLNGISYLGVLLSLRVIKTPYRIPRTQGALHPLNDMREGLRYARHNEQVAKVLWLSLACSVFIVPLIQMLPSVATVILHSPKEGYAALSVGQGFGAVLAGLMVTRVANRWGYLRALHVCVIANSLLMITFALQTSLPLAVMNLALMWVFVLMGFICINTTLQMAVTDTYRGRISSLYTITWSGVTPFGALILGLIANHFSTPPALILYALIGLASSVAVLWWYRTDKQAELVLETSTEKGV